MMRACCRWSLCVLCVFGVPWGGHVAWGDTASEVMAHESDCVPEGLTPEQWARFQRKMARGPKPHDQPAEAQQFYLEQRTGGAPLDYGQIAEAISHVVRMPVVDLSTPGMPEFAPGAKAAGDLSNWVELGPGNIGGRTRALLIDPGNSNVIYAGGVAGGVWKSVNGGQSWAPLDDLMDNLAITQVVFAGQGGPNVDTTTLYASTGEGFFNADGVRGAGVFKSTDSGATWTQLAATNNSNFHYTNDLVASANDLNTLYAATGTGIYKTMDGGTSWNVVLENNGLGVGSGGTDALTAAGFTDIEIRTDLALPNEVVIGSAGNLFDSDGIYRTVNGGATWTRVFTTTGLGRSDLAIAPSNQNVMYALAADIQNNDRLLNVFRSDDGGATWIPRVMGTFDQRDPSWLLLTNPIIANLSTCFSQGGESQLNQGWYDNIIAVAPHNESIVFAGGIDLFRSDDGGQTWGPISYWWITTNLPEYAHADHHTIIFDPGWDGAANQMLYAGHDGGISRTANALAAVSTGTVGGTEGGICYNAPAMPTAVVWENLNNSYAVTQFYHGRPYPDGFNAYFGGTQDNGTLEGNDSAGANGWVPLFGGDGGYVSYDPNDSNPDANPTVFLETTRKSMVRSFNGGPFESVVGNLTENSGNFLFIAPFRHDPSNRDRIWYGGRAPWRSNNISSQSVAALVTWSQAGANLDGTPISAFAIDPGNSDIVFAGTAGGKVFRQTAATTSTSADTWDDVTPPYTDDAYISWVEEDPGNGNNVYACNSRFSGERVFKSMNGGNTWTNITGNLPAIPVHCVVVAPFNSNILFAGTDLGVYVSKNGGSSWASVNDPGFANVVTETLEFQDMETLYAFTHGRGAFRATVAMGGGDCPSMHPADTSGDSSLAISELTAYGAAWKSGAAWPAPPNPIPIGYVTRAGFLWKSGEAYTDDCTDPPNRWVPAGGNKTQAGRAAGSATRAISGNSVTLSVVPEAAVSNYALEEILPDGVTPVALGGGAVFDAVLRKIRFGPFFDNTARTLTYQLEGPAGTYTVSGLASFDGNDIVVTGDAELTLEEDGGEGEGEGEAAPCPTSGVHSADSDASGTLSLQEVLRVVQLLNSGGFGCEDGTEDDFAPNDPDHDCCPHDSDYLDGSSWRIELSEVLRLIQFFNAGGYSHCPEGGTEDGYCPAG